MWLAHHPNETAKNHYEKQNPNLDAVLGGQPIHEPDLKSSLKVLMDYKNHMPDPLDAAIDLGAGIGRLSAGLFCPLFQHVDSLE